MLDTLQIENYALIEQLAIEFGPGFNALTGETGSGKSIIVDALGLLLGERAEAGVIRTGAALATVTGLFSTTGQPEILLRREISTGRSRVLINDALATLAGLRAVARPLGEIHSQNEALVAFTPLAQLEMLDRYANVDARPVAGAFATWQAASEALRLLQSESQQRLQQQDQWRFQAQEIDAVRPLAGEDALLDAERNLLAHAERIVAAFEAAYAALYDSPEAVTTQLKAAARQVQEWQRWDESVAPLVARLEGLRAESDDIAAELRQRGARVESSPARLAQVEERLAAIERLRRKYGPTLAEVLEHRARLAASLDAASQASLDVAQAAVDAATASYRKLAEALSRKRRAASAKLARAVETEVRDLAMTLRFEVRFEDDASWRASGCDRLQFLASLNPGEPALPIAAIASGGELSRLLLALHLVIETQANPGSGGASRSRQLGDAPSASGRPLPGSEACPPSDQRERPGQKVASHRTLVLDEIDAGIGGRAAEAVGRKLQQLGQHHQVLCVTHLAQIAAFAATHLQVEKQVERGRTRTRVTRLEGPVRAAEIARMLAGKSEDPTALRHATELLAAHAQAGLSPRRGVRSRG